MLRKLLILAVALFGALLLNSWVARAAPPSALQAAGGTRLLHLPLVFRSQGITADSLPPAAPTAVPAPAPNPSGPSVYTGVSLQGAPWDMNPVLDWERNVAGKPVSIVHFWSFWSVGGQFQPFNRAVMDNIRNHGSIPMVTWAPEEPGVWQDQPQFRLAHIIAGKYDASIQAWADGAKAWGHPFFLRFAHEANGSWFPWGEDTNGNQRGEYVRAWRHVRDIFTARGATNATWVWCMNEDWNGSPRPSFASLYPGDSYVDWTCLDGYNWGTQYGGWRSFDGVFRYAYDTILAVAPSKPVMLAEWATSGTGGSAADWISDAFGPQILANYPAIRAEVWYNVSTNVDWRVESWPAAPRALRAVLSGSKYRGAEFGQLSASPIPAP